MRMDYIDSDYNGIRTLSHKQEGSVFLYLDETGSGVERKKDAFKQLASFVTHKNHISMQGDGERSLPLRDCGRITDETLRIDLLSAAFPNSDSKTDRDPRQMYPWVYRKRAKPLGRFTTTFNQNFLVQSWRPIMGIFMLISFPIALVTQQGWLPPSIIPYDTEAAGLFFTVFTFFISVLASGSLGRMSSIQRSIIVDLSGQMADSAILFTRALKNETFSQRARLEGRTCSRDGSYQIVGDRSATAFEVYMNVAYILSAFPYAFIHVYKESSQFDLEKLPLKRIHKDMIKCKLMQGIPPLEAMRAILLDNMFNIINASYTVPQSAASHTGEIKGYGSIIGNLDYYAKIPPIHPIQRQVMYIALVFFCASLPISLYQYWGLQVGVAAYYIVLLISVSFIVGFFYSNDIISDPFNSSIAVSLVDLKEIMHGIAETNMGIFLSGAEQLFQFSLSDIYNGKSMDEGNASVGIRGSSSRRLLPNNIISKT